MIGGHFSQTFAWQPGTPVLLVTGSGSFMSALDSAASLLVIPLIQMDFAAGLAAGLFVSPNNSAMIGAAPSEMRGSASAMIGLVRNFGMVFGTAFSGALLALRPESLLSGFHLAMQVGALIALGGVVLGSLQNGGVILRRRGLAR